MVAECRGGGLGGLCLEQCITARATASISNVSCVISYFLGCLRSLSWKTLLTDLIIPGVAETRRVEREEKKEKRRLLKSLLHDGGAWLVRLLQALQGSFHVAFCSRKRLAVAPPPHCHAQGAPIGEVYSFPGSPYVAIPWIVAGFADTGRAPRRGCSAVEALDNHQSLVDRQITP
jgi:hypothetical protein